MRKSIEIECCVCGKKIKREIRKHNESVKLGWKETCSSKCLRISRGAKIKKCANCGKEIICSLSRLKKSKTGNVFCDKHCSTSYNNRAFKTGENHPNYVDGAGSYREKAFSHNPHKCAICNWSEDERVLEVHHIDENRKNNSLKNLIILCPICHKFLTLHIYTLKELFNLRGNRH